MNSFLHAMWGEPESAYGATRCSPQQDQIPSLVTRSCIQSYVHTNHAVPKCLQDSSTGLNIKTLFINMN